MNSHYREVIVDECSTGLLTGSLQMAATEKLQTAAASDSERSMTGVGTTPDAPKRTTTHTTIPTRTTGTTGTHPGTPYQRVSATVAPDVGTR